jgi:hypothetical protein
MERSSLSSNAIGWSTSQRIARQHSPQTGHGIIRRSWLSAGTVRDSTLTVHDRVRHRRDRACRSPSSGVRSSTIRVATVPSRAEGSLSFPEAEFPGKYAPAVCHRD